MGAKVRSPRASGDIDAFVAGIAPEHRATFTSLRGLIKQVAPEATETLKWGTLAYDYNGSLFALSAPKGVVNLYILTVGLLAKHQDLLGAIPQSKCCLRFAPSAKPPLPALRKVMNAAVAASAKRG